MFDEPCADMEVVRCNNCGSTSYDVHLVRQDLSTLRPDEFRLVRCLDCGLIYLNPRPTRECILSYYGTGYDQYTPAVAEEPRWIARMARRYGLRKRVKAIARYVQGGRLLDVGCATGDFILELERCPGWQGYGLEPNPRAAAYCSQKLRLHVDQGTLESASYPTGFFDVVTFWNVLEHLHDPGTALRLTYDLLKPGGLLVISTPLVDTVGAKFFGQYWIGYELPRHLYVFSHQTLMALLGHTGFETLKLSCLYGGYASVASSIRFWLRATFPPGRSLKILERLLFSNVLRLVAAPLFAVMGRFAGLCSIPTLFAVKRV